AMTDAREALVDGERVDYGEAWDALVPEVGRTVGQIVTSTIDAILAAGWTPPTVKPSVEDVARALAEHRPIEDGRGAIIACGCGLLYGVQHPESEPRSAHLARAVLALLPGRTEAEVR